VLCAADPLVLACPFAVERDPDDRALEHRGSAVMACSTSMLEMFSPP
jgi:hypothetical protein